MSEPMVDQATLEDSYREVKSRVAAAAEKSGRRADQVYLVAVTKYAEPEDIRRLLEIGHRDFGEGRGQQLVQRAALIGEWFDRVRMLPETVSAAEREHLAADCGLGNGAVSVDIDQPVRWHMIGHVQRNKARKVAECSRLVHSVDSLRLAEELQQAAGRLGREIEVLVQVNVSGEESKFGCPLPAAQTLCEQIDNMLDVRVRGLMTMAPLSDDPESARPVFRRCRELYEDIARLGLSEGRFNLLSMGMSSDYEMAIEEGANIVRVGTAIFGHRAPQD